ncbi:MAG: hypothetical protein ACI9ES_001858 [Oceanospirillaceae bacterium]|jgi:hypothetical protein
MLRNPSVFWYTPFNKWKEINQPSVFTVAVSISSLKNDPLNKEPIYFMRCAALYIDECFTGAILRFKEGKEGSQ